MQVEEKKVEKEVDTEEVLDEAEKLMGKCKNE